MPYYNRVKIELSLINITCLYKIIFLTGHNTIKNSVEAYNIKCVVFVAKLNIDKTHTYKEKRSNTHNLIIAGVNVYSRDCLILFTFTPRLISLFAILFTELVSSLGSITKSSNIVEGVIS